MGASYVGAWSGFFAINPVFGVGEDWQVWLTVFGPDRRRGRLHRASGATVGGVSAPTPPPAVGLEVEGHAGADAVDFALDIPPNQSA